MQGKEYMNSSDKDCIRHKATLANVVVKVIRSFFVLFLL